MDPISMLKSDHRRVEKLFARFEKLGERASATKLSIVKKLIQELDLHAMIEEEVVYPTIRQWLPDMDDNVLEAYEEHHLVKRTLRELENMTPDDELFDAKVCVLGEAVQHHVEEEEDEILPAMKKALGKDEMRELMKRMQAVKKQGIPMQRGEEGTGETRQRRAA